MSTLLNAHFEWRFAFFDGGKPRSKTCAHHARSFEVSRWHQDVYGHGEFRSDDSSCLQIARISLRRRCIKFWFLGAFGGRAHHACFPILSVGRPFKLKALNHPLFLQLG